MTSATWLRAHVRPVVAVVAVLVLGGATVAAVAARPDEAPSTTSATQEARVASPRSVSTDGFQDPAAQTYTAPPAGAVPVRVRIPAIGVDSGLEDLGLGAAGELDAPEEWMSAGWYEDGVVPGGVGPAIIAGHVDSSTGPAVFIDLPELAAGDEVLVTLSTGDVHTFSVTGSETAPKANFPTSDVYGSTPTPTLRLITCDGRFDSSTGHYEDNLIVFADLVS
jgi:sortase (surface protein transpeptidase)